MGSFKLFSQKLRLQHAQEQVKKMVIDLTEDNDEEQTKIRSIKKVSTSCLILSE